MKLISRLYAKLKSNPSRTKKFLICLGVTTVVFFLFSWGIVGLFDNEPHEKVEYRYTDYQTDIEKLQNTIFVICVIVIMILVIAYIHFHQLDKQIHSINIDVIDSNAEVLGTFKLINDENEKSLRLILDPALEDILRKF